MERPWRHGPIQESDHAFYGPNFVPRGYPGLHNSIEFGEPRYWPRKPNMNSVPYGGLQTRDSGSIMLNCADDFTPYSYVGDEYLTSGYRNNKRMRVCDANPAEYHQNSLEDAYRLKLIRDHGVGVYPPSQLNQNPESFHSGLVLNKNFSNGNVMEYGAIGNSLNEVNFRAPGPLIHNNSFVNQEFCSTESGLSFAQQSMNRHDFHNPSKSGQESNGYFNFPNIPYRVPPNLKRKDYYSLICSERDNDNGASSENSNMMQAAGLHGVLSTLPTPQQPPLPLISVVHASAETTPSSSPLKAPSPPFPIFHTAIPTHSAYPALDASFFSHPFSKHKSNSPVSSKFFNEPKVVDASQLFMLPFGATRVNHFVIILRGLPGSGKSYIAKMLRDLEVENGGKAPRIHSMDEYFMTEVEKVEENGALKSSTTARGRKPVVKKVMEYCYEPEMEEAYRSSMLKAFRKTLEESNFTFVIVDDRNLRVADFAQFWAMAKGLGYEVYLLEATYKDPTGCAARNVHGFTLEDIQKMATYWEEAPTMYWQLDIKSLFHGDDIKASKIQEVDMDVDDEDVVKESVPVSVDKTPEKIESLHCIEDSALHEDWSGGRRWEEETDVKEVVGRSKWLDDAEEDDESSNVNALSALIHTYTKPPKTLRWADQITPSSGFCIGAAKKQSSSLSLVIGAGAGYNSSSNPLLPEEEARPASKERHDTFKERMRAEQESFKAIFGCRKNRAEP